jgi:hypothetical protein
MGEMRSGCKVLVGKHKENRPLGRDRCICEENIKEIGERVLTGLI